MMSNENPNPPSEKVLEAINKYARMGNRYPDQGLVVRSKIAEIKWIGRPENVLLGNGSSEVYETFSAVSGSRRGSHSAYACFGIYKLRGTILGAKMVLYRWSTR